MFIQETYCATRSQTRALLAVVFLAFGAVTIGAATAHADHGPATHCPPPALNGGWEATDGNAVIQGAFFDDRCSQHTSDAHYVAEIYGQALEGFCPPGGCEARAWYWGENGQFVSFNFVDGTTLLCIFTANPDGTANVNIYYYLGATLLDAWTEVMSR
jgi:hypothetical protein